MSQDHPLIKNLTSTAEQLQNIHQRLTDALRFDDHRFLNSLDRQTLHTLRRRVLQDITAIESINSRVTLDIHTYEPLPGDPGSDPIADQKDQKSPSPQDITPADPY